MPYRSVHILLVEDDEIDVLGVQRAFRQEKIVNPMTVVPNGLEALAVLRGTAADPPLARPYLVLLDLNMPRMNGLEFLAELRADPRLSDTIVFVLTTSNEDRDKVAAYQQHIAGYLVKSKVGDDFLAMIKMLDCYWRLIEFPPEHP